MVALAALLLLPALVDAQEAENTTPDTALLIGPPRTTVSGMVRPGGSRFFRYTPARGVGGVVVTVGVRPAAGVDLAQVRVRVTDVAGAIIREQDLTQVRSIGRADLILPAAAGPALVQLENGAASTLAYTVIFTDVAPLIGVPGAAVTSTPGPPPPPPSATPILVRPLAQRQEGSLPAAAGGSFANYDFVYPGGGVVVDVELRFIPADPVTLRAVSLLLFAPDGRTLEEVAAQPDRQAGIAGFRLDRGPAGRYLVQVANWAPRSTIAYTLTAVDADLPAVPPSFTPAATPTATATSPPTATPEPTPTLEPTPSEAGAVSPPTEVAPPAAAPTPEPGPALEEGPGGEGALPAEEGEDAGGSPGEEDGEEGSHQRTPQDESGRTEDGT